MPFAGSVIRDVVAKRFVSEGKDCVEVALIFLQAEAVPADSKEMQNHTPLPRYGRPARHNGVSVARAYHLRRIATGCTCRARLGYKAHQNREFHSFSTNLFPVKPKSYKPKNLPNDAAWQYSCVHGTQANCHNLSYNKCVSHEIAVNIIPIIRRKVS